MSVENKKSRTVMVTGGLASLEQRIQVGPHALVGDEQTSAGGTDRGPNPYDYLLSALGTCTSMTLHMYAKRKDWPVETIEVTLTHARIYAKDCEDCESQTGMAHEITRKIRVTGDLSDEQRERLLEIANKCPVHRTLTHEIKIRSELVDPLQ